MPLTDMPGRNERSAPSFNGSQPEELDRYFADLQALLDRHGVNDSAECKQAAVKYLDIQTEKLWKTTAAWSDNTNTFDEFKAEVLRFYPGVTGDRAHTIQDLDLVIGHYARVGILSGTDLGEYYRRFILITRYLIDKNRMSTQEQSRYFFRGFQPQLEAPVRQRLQQKFIDHFPADPYDLADIYDAASYVLTGAASMSLALLSPQQATNPATPSQPDANSVKIEALTAMVASLGEMFKVAIQSQQAGAKPRSTGVTASGIGAPGGSACNFCGMPGHYIRDCEVVAEYTRSGKCKRSPDNRVVLPSGAMVPRSITGAWLRDRVDEYHRQNPGQMAAQMLFEVASIATAPPNDAAGQSNYSYPTRHVDQYYNEDSARTYALNRPTRPRPEVVITTRPPRQSGRVGRGENAGGANSEVTPQVQSEEAPPPRIQEVDDEAPETSAAKKDKHVAFAPEPTHPYAAAPDATHGAISGISRPTMKEPAPVGKPEPVYTTSAKIHDPRIAKVVYERAMETPITITQRELLSLSPEVRAQLADVTARKRLSRDNPALVMVNEVPDPESDKYLRKFEDAQEKQAGHMPAAFAHVARIPPADATIIADPYEAYLRLSSGNTDPRESIRVAAESNALRAILPVVDGQEKVEAILDPGCQIVAMSEEICNAFALPYDPSIRLNMVSANGGVDQSLGLARNIPFLVGDITLYLQVHILREPAYDILLGRPFDVLTQSVVRNFPNEDQTVTILDPNTSKKATVPTIARGSHRFVDRKIPKAKTVTQDF